MKKYVIITDSCSDLEKSFRDEYDIICVPNTYSFDNKTYKATVDWEDHSPKEYYDLLRNGVKIISSQVNRTEYYRAFEEAILNGYDILSISVSSGLSSSYNSSLIVKDEILKKYQDSKIICIDTLISSLGLALICIHAAELRREGKSIEEVAEWIENNKFTVRQEGTVDKLVFLKRAGRISAASAFFGGLLNIKPIIISDVRGKNVAIEKVKGRKASFERIATRIYDKIVDVPYQRILIAHADCYDEALELRETIISKLSNKNLDIRISYVGQAIGASVGPGTLIAYYYGEAETYDSESE